SDGTNDNGFLPFGCDMNSTPTGACPLPDSWPLPRVAVTNYAMSHGDNYTYTPLNNNPQWEDTPPIPAGKTRRGRGGLGGPSGILDVGREPGVMRGFADYRTNQTTTMAGVTDGTSNTLLVGEVIPSQSANTEFWTITGATAGTTLPLNLDTSRKICS